MTDHLPEPLIATLDIVASAAAGLQDPWWVFGGAAMALAGLEDLSVPDVDILTSARDARAGASKSRNRSSCRRMAATF